MRAAVVELDGTVYRSTDPVTGAVEGINCLRSAGLEVLFVSNTSSKSRESCRNRLVDTGINVALEDILTSASIAANYVAESYPGATVMAIGEDTLRDELVHTGVHLTEEPDAADVLIVGKDRSFDFEMLTAAVHALNDGAQFVVTNRDRRSPTSEGILPGTGAIVAAAGREPEVVGKPNDPTIEAILNRLGQPVSDCLIIGDNVETDIAIGEQAGMTTVLIESGLDSSNGSENVHPDYVFGSMAAIDKVLVAEGGI